MNVLIYNENKDKLLSLNIDVNVLRNKLISLGFNKITSNINDIEIIVNNS